MNQNPDQAKRGLVLLNSRLHVQGLVFQFHYDGKSSFLLEELTPKDALHGILW